MKPQHKLIAIVLAASFCLTAPSLSRAAVPLSWEVKPGQAAPVAFDRFHGESLQLSAEFVGFSEPPFAPDADVRLWYQTNGMGSAWWSVPASVESNRVSAAWSPELDPGAGRVTLFFGAPSNAYCSAVLRLRGSPGMVPNALPLPVQRLDFAALDVSNAPYYTKAEADAKIVELAPAPGNYETVSNRAMIAATKADATLAEHYSEWTISPATDSWGDPYTMELSSNDPITGYWELLENGSLVAFSTAAGPNATTASFTTMYGQSVSAWRSVQGYQLGSDTNHILAAQKDMPGDYSTVSNRAMTALQSYTESDPAFAWWASGFLDENSNVDFANRAGTADAAGNADHADHAGYAEYAAEAAMALNPASGGEIDTRLAALEEGIPSVALTNETLYVNGRQTNVVVRYANGAVDLGTRKAGTSKGSYSVAEGNAATAIGEYSHAEGYHTTASGEYSHAEGYGTIAKGSNSHAEGCQTRAWGMYSHAGGLQAVTAAAGNGASVQNPHNYAWAWNGNPNISYYHSHGHGTFNISPLGGTDGFWIGETNFTQHVRNIAAAVAPPPTPAAEPRRIAMFVMEVNPWVMLRHTLTNNTSNTIYTGFELKASTNNFAKSASDSVKLQFWSQSHSADTGVEGSDKMRIYMPVGNDPGCDMRSYRRIQNTIDVPNSQLARLVVLVDVSCLVRHTEDGGAWLNEDNADLVWVYMRDTAGGTETYPGTDTKWWHPIAPVRWFRKMPNWAN